MTTTQLFIIFVITGFLILAGAMVYVLVDLYFDLDIQIDLTLTDEGEVL